MWCTQYANKFGEVSSRHRTGKGQVLFQSQKGNVNEHSNYVTIVQLGSFHMLVRLCSKSFKLAFSSSEQRTSRCKGGFRKGRGRRDQIANIYWIRKKGNSRKKTSTSTSLTTQKPFTVWITTNYGKFLRRWEYQTTLPVSWETCFGQEAIGHGTNFVQNWERKNKVVNWHSAYLAYAECIMRNAELDDSQAGIKIARRNINNLRFIYDTTLRAENEEELKRVLMWVKETWNSTFKKTKIMASCPITSWQIERGKVGAVTDFPFLGFKLTADGDCSYEIQDVCPLKGKLWQT